MILAGTGCNKLKSRDHMNQGRRLLQERQVCARRWSFFKKAIQLDPDNPNAAHVSGDRLHDAMDSRRGIAGKSQFAAKAKDEFLKVLEKDPNEKMALGVSGHRWPSTRLDRFRWTRS